jgi:hypothetical protein
MYSEVINMKLRILTILVVVSVFLGLAAYAEGFPLGVLPSPPSSGEPLSVYVWTDESVVNTGDQLTIHLRVSRPAFLYLFDLQPDGLVRLIFPNSFATNNYVTSSTYDVPDEAYNLTVTPPAGIEEFLVFACDTPLPISLGTAQDPFRVYAMNPTQAINQLVAIVQSFTESPMWAVGWHAIQIAGDGQADHQPQEITLPPPPARPPFNDRPATAWHMVNGSWQMGIPQSGWYWYFDINAYWHLCLITD